MIYTDIPGMQTLIFVANTTVRKFKFVVEYPLWKSWWVPIQRNVGRMAN